MWLQSQTNELDTKMMGSVASARRQADALLAIVDSAKSPEEAAEELQLVSETQLSLPTALVHQSLSLDPCTSGHLWCCLGCGCQAMPCSSLPDKHVRPQVLNKVDVLKGEAEVAYLQALLQEKCAVDIVIPTSALTGRGVDDVKQWAAAQLPPGPSLYPQASK